MSDLIPLPQERLLAYQQAIRLLLQVQGMRLVDARLRDQLLEPETNSELELDIELAVGGDSKD